MIEKKMQYNSYVFCLILLLYNETLNINNSYLNIEKYGFDKTSPFSNQTLHALLMGTFET